MRSRRILIFIALLVLLACAVLGACDGSYKNKEELPLKPWQDYIGEISSAIDRHYINISTKRQIAFELDLEAVEESSGDKYECSLALNLNVGQRTGQAGALRITRIRGEEKKILLDVYNSDEMLYWCLWNEDAGEYERVSFEHAPLIYTVIQAVGLLGDGVDYTTPGALFEAMAEVFFTDATVNDKEGTKFTFDFDLKKGLDSTFSRDAFFGLPEVLQKLFFTVSKVENYEDMLSETPSLKGKINIDLKDGLIDRIYCERLKYFDSRNGAERTLNVNVPKFRVENDSLDLSRFQPDGSLYINGRLTDVTCGGTVKLKNSADGKSVMQYEYEFKAKVDILDLLAAQGDFNALASDNFFHFRLSHKCDADCGAFCADKYDKAKGAILDIAFSPQDFGSYNIYISVGARAFLGSRIVSQWTGLERILRNQIPEYLLAVISADTLSRQTFAYSGGRDGEEDSGGRTFLEEILMSLIYDGSSLSFPIERMLEIAGLDENTVGKIMSIFKGDGYFADTAELEQTYLRWSVQRYDVKRSAIHLYGYDVEGTKQYTMGLMNKTPALNYDYKGEKIIADDGEKTVVGIYNDLYQNGVLFDAQTPICATETQDIIGSYVKAQAEDIYGDKFDCELYITGHSEIDVLQSGWQEIELYCIPVGRGNIENMLWEAIRAQEWGKWLSMTVKTYVRIDELDSVKFIRPENVAFMQGEKISASDARSIDRIRAEISYKNGKVKNRSVAATNADEMFVYDYIGNKYVGSEEDIVMNFYLFGRYCGVKASITPAREKSLIISLDELNLELNENGYNSELRVATMKWIMADGSVSEARLPLSYAKINGYTLSQSNEYFYINPTLSSTSVVFRREGKYILSYECDGLYAETILFISPKSQEVSKSEYALVNKTDPSADYFVGYAYNFDAEIVNTYHGEEGRDLQLNMQIRVGYINSLGSISYKLVDDPQNYYKVQSVLLDNKNIELPYTVSLPPTIYKSISLRLKVSFIQSGYYEMRITLGSSTCSIKVQARNALR